LTASLSGCLPDPRQASKVDYFLRVLFAQRVFPIGSRYADANDFARLAADPMHKMLLDRDPVTGLAMASQSTLSPF
jgi:Transposase DDE domain group 1